MCGVLCCNLPERTFSADIPCEKVSGDIPPSQTLDQTGRGSRSPLGHAGAPLV